MQRVLMIVSGRSAAVRSTSWPVKVSKRLACVAALVVIGGTLTAAEANFAVHGGTQEQAVAIARHAEEIRQRAFAELLGVERPTRWRVPCEIHVHATPAAFAAAVGGPPATARGATSIEFTGAEVSLRRIDVMGEASGAIPDALAHELVHVVLADHFTSGPPPRWADEGLAVLFDPAATQRAHDTDFRTAARRGMAWSAAELMRLEEYPHEAGRQRVFYGQSAALVRWLLERRDTATFIRFLDDCVSDGDRAALARHYGLESFAQLEQSWTAGPVAPDRR